jgi:hypothetical protein
VEGVTVALEGVTVWTGAGSAVVEEVVTVRTGAGATAAGTGGAAASQWRLDATYLMQGDHEPGITDPIPEK